MVSFKTFAKVCLLFGTAVSLLQFSLSDCLYSRFTAPQAQTEMVLVCSVCYELLMNQADREKQS